MRKPALPILHINFSTILGMLRRYDNRGKVSNLTPVFNISLSLSKINTFTLVKLNLVTRYGHVNLIKLIIQPIKPLITVSPFIKPN